MVEEPHVEGGQMRRSLMVIGLLALCAQVTGRPVAGAEPDGMEASALAFREGFGLDASPGTIRAIALDPKARRERGRRS